jgi:DNA-binding IclR family transcriptional regulator
VDILNYLIAHPTQSFTLSELARQLEMNVASAHTVLAVLASAGYVVRHPGRKTYALGPLLVAAGHAALERYPAIALAGDEIRKLSRQFGVELVVTAAAGDEIVALVRAGPRNPYGLEVGRRVPLIPPLGSVFVAWGTPEEVDLWLQRAGRRTTRTTVERYRRVLDTVRQRGYSVALQAGASGALSGALAEMADRPTAQARRNLDEILGELGHGEYHLDDVKTPGAYNIGMIAAPVFDGDGRAVLALALSDFPRPLAVTDIIAWANRLRDTALVVTRQAHGQVPEGRSPAHGSHPVPQPAGAPAADDRKASPAKPARRNGGRRS